MASVPAQENPNDDLNPAPDFPRTYRRPHCKRGNGSKRFSKSMNERSDQVDTSTNGSQHDRSYRGNDYDGPSGRQANNDNRYRDSGRASRGRQSRPSFVRGPSGGQRYGAPHLPDLRSLREAVGNKYEADGLRLLSLYIRNRFDLATFQTNRDFLLDCDALSVVPIMYRLRRSNQRETRFFQRLLDRFSFEFMFCDLRHKKKRSSQIISLLKNRTDRMKELFDETTYDQVIKLVGEHFDFRVQKKTEEYARILDELIEEYELNDEDIEKAKKRRAHNEMREKKRIERLEAKRAQRRENGFGRETAAGENIEAKLSTPSNQIDESEEPESVNQTPE